MDLKRFGAAEPFQHVIIPETRREAQVMQQVVRLALQGSLPGEGYYVRKPSTRVLKGLAKTLDFAERVGGVSDTHLSFNGVVVPPQESSVLGMLLGAAASEARLKERSLTVDDELVAEMSAQIHEAFAM